MKRQLRTIVMFYFIVTLVVQANADEPLKVDTKGVTAKILYETPISGGAHARIAGQVQTAGY